MLICVRQGWQCHCGRMWGGTGLLGMPERGKKVLRTKDVGLFIVEIDMGSRLELVLLQQIQKFLG